MSPFAATLSLKGKDTYHHMSCQCLLCLKNCRIIAQSLEHVYDNEHETRKGREFDILPIFGMCSVYLQRRRFALPLFLWLFTNWRQNSNWQISIVFNIQNHESMDPYSIFIHVLFGRTKYDYESRSAILPM